MEQQPILEQSGELLKKYTYRDNSVGGEVVFECIAKDILEADQKYQEKTGENITKQAHIGCSFEPVSE